MISANYNPSIFKAQNNLNTATMAINKSLTRMSTGFKINSASDDAAGLYIATRLNTQIRGLKQAQANVNNGLSYLNIAESSLNNMTGILNRVRDLAVQSANGIYSNDARTAMQTEVDALVAELSRVKESAMFNGINVFDSSITTSNTPPPTGRSTGVAGVTADTIPAGYTAIYTAEDLNNIRNNMSGKYILMNDIDLSGVDWEPIGEANPTVTPNIFTPFTGTLDGNGYVIRNMSIDNTQEAQGLFGYIKDATIKNLGIENAHITGGARTGILAGYATHSATIENCYAIDSVITSAGYCGGLIGSADFVDLEMNNCYTNVEISKATKFCGGLIGIIQEYGTSFKTANIKNSYALGNITTFNDVAGGLIGDIRGNNDLANTDLINIENSYATGNITAGGSAAGGLVGNSMFTNLIIKNCYATGNIKGNYECGGIIGYRYGADHYTTIENCYSTGYVNCSNSDSSGGIIGLYEVWDSNDKIENCYYNKQTSGKSTISCDDASISSNIVNCKGLTSAEMKDANNFASWDTDIWDFSSGMPTLKNMPEYAGVLPNYTRLQIGEASDAITNAILIDTSINLNRINVDFSTAQSATASIENIDKLLNTITNKMAEIGATQNRLESVLESQSTRLLNYTAAKSTIMDSDIAEESATFVKEQILQRTTTALLSQAQNIQAGAIMSLISGL